MATAALTANERALPLPTKASRAYWVCQAVGWFLYFSVTAYQLSRAKDVVPSRIVVEPLLAVIVGIALTHAFRKMARHRRWPLLGAGALAPRVVLSSIALAFALVLVLAVVEVGIYRDQQPSVVVLIVFATMRWSMVFFIWLAIYFGHALIEHRREEQVRLLQLEKALQAAELRTLRSQLNPHFLFNSLNSIRALIAADPTIAQDAVTRMAKILRYTLAAGREQTVTLERELEVVDDYLALEALRLDKRLVVEREIDDNVRRVTIPIMLLQILVENAIKHGIAHLPKGGVLKIIARPAHDDAHALLIEVQNPRPTVLSASAKQDDDSGIGLTNISERIALLYGSSAKLALDLSVADRAITTVRIPCEQAE